MAGTESLSSLVWCLEIRPPAPSSSGLQTVSLTPSLPASQNDLRGPALSTHLNRHAFSLAVLLSVAFSPESEDFPPYSSSPNYLAPL